MFVGHYSASFLGKAKEGRVPLWLLFLAVQFVDILWAVFVLLGIEKVRIVPGFTAGSPLDLYYMPYTHSLLGAISWSLLAAMLCQTAKRLRGLRTGTVIAAAVFSHWILDLVVHRPDLSLYGNHFKMGLGLWNYLWPSFLLELLVLWLGAWIYLRAVPDKTRLLGFVVLLSVIQYVGTFYFPPPPSDRAEATMALLLYFLFASLAGWADARNRRSIGRAAGASAS
jgi:hypothetical protein